MKLLEAPEIHPVGDVLHGSSDLSPDFCPECDSALHFVCGVEGEERPGSTNLRVERCCYCNRDYLVADQVVAPH